MVGSALARIVLSSEPMNTGSSTPKTTSIVSRCVRLLGPLGGGCASMAPLCALAGCGLCVPNSLPDGERGRRHREVVDAVVAQRIDDGADDDRERRRRAAFAAGLHAERICRGQHLNDLGLER